MHRRRVRQHYASFWGDPIDAMTWPQGPVHEMPRGFEVARYRRTKDTEAYATVGLSAVDGDYLTELYLIVNPSDGTLPGLVELLTFTAHYHLTGAPLGPAHTVNFGRPWQPGSACDRGYLSLPYLDVPAFEWIETPTTHFLWLIPITPAEAELKRQLGFDALEKRFQEAQLDYRNPFRTSVV